MPLTILIPLLFITLSAQSPSTLNITIQTSKPSYQTDESIEVCGNLTYNGSPVQDELVGLEIVDPNHDPVVTRTLQTNTYGSYSIAFKLPSDAKLGKYTVYVSSSYNAQTATNTTTFHLLRAGGGLSCAHRGVCPCLY